MLFLWSTFVVYICVVNFELVSVQETKFSTSRVAKDWYNETQYTWRASDRFELSYQKGNWNTIENVDQTTKLTKKGITTGQNRRNSWTSWSDNKKRCVDETHGKIGHEWDKFHQWTLVIEWMNEEVNNSDTVR